MEKVSFCCLHVIWKKYLIFNSYNVESTIYHSIFKHLTRVDFWLIVYSIRRTARYPSCFQSWKQINIRVTTRRGDLITSLITYCAPLSNRGKIWYINLIFNPLTTSGTSTSKIHATGWQPCRDAIPSRGRQTHSGEAVALGGGSRPNR